MNQALVAKPGLSRSCCLSLSIAWLDMPGCVALPLVEVMAVFHKTPITSMSIGRGKPKNHMSILCVVIIKAIKPNQTPNTLKPQPPATQFASQHQTLNPAPRGPTSSPRRTSPKAPAGASKAAPAREGVQPSSFDGLNVKMSGIPWSSCLFEGTVNDATLGGSVFGKCSNHLPQVRGKQDVTSNTST